MYKPLFFTAMFSLYAAFSPVDASAEPASPGTQAAKPCPDGKVWDQILKRCVSKPRGSHDGGN